MVGGPCRWPRRRPVVTCHPEPTPRFWMAVGTPADGPPRPSDRPSPQAVASYGGGQGAEQRGGRPTAARRRHLYNYVEHFCVQMSPPGRPRRPPRCSAPRPPPSDAMACGLGRSMGRGGPSAGVPTRHPDRTTLHPEPSYRASYHASILDDTDGASAHPRTGRRGPSTGPVHRVLHQMAGGGAAFCTTLTSVKTS
jgi:hypothetical protein